MGTGISAYCARQSSARTAIRSRGQLDGNAQRVAGATFRHLPTHARPPIPASAALALRESDVSARPRSVTLFYVEAVKWEGLRSEVVWPRLTPRSSIYRNRLDSRFRSFSEELNSLLQRPPLSFEVSNTIPSETIQSCDRHTRMLLRNDSGSGWTECGVEQWRNTPLDIEM